MVLERTASQIGCTRRVAVEMASFSSLTAIIISLVIVNSFLDMDKGVRQRAEDVGKAGKKSG